MMNIIHKFLIFPNHGYLNFDFPIGSKVLAFQNQGQTDVYVWVLKSSSVETEMRSFICIMTGQPVPNEFLLEHRYIGTAQICNGSIVIHLFERIKEASHD